MEDTSNRPPTWPGAVGPIDYAQGTSPSSPELTDELASPSHGTAPHQPSTPEGSRWGVRRRVVPLLLVGVISLSGLTGAAAGAVATYATLANSPRPIVAAEKVGLSAPLRPVAAITDPGTATAIYQQAAASVVSVRSAISSRGFTQEGEGSGVVVDNQGHVLTNYHVVDGAGRLRIQLADGSTFDAEVVGKDPASDLALLKADLPADRVTAAKLGDSDDVQVGEPAIAIGNPFGLDHTMTMGIVSATNRDFGTAGGRPMRGLIQTDAPINPGNSGGPLFNARGEVIGITTAIESPVRGSVGIGFAIPVNRAKYLLPQLQRGEAIQHPYVGISGLALTPEIAKQLGLSTGKGVLVAQVVEDGPAARAGIRGGRVSATDDVPRGGDVILAVDGKAIANVQELSGYLDQKQVGDTVSVRLLRDGKELTIPVTLGAWPVGNLR